MMLSCFALHGVTPLGVANRYQCGLPGCLDTGLEARGIEFRTMPPSMGSLRRDG